ncbi:uncharacterized protein LOC126374491 [Pectinophora gossypiella]|uniref:uncharacterized protein LOC126374491 n=1 Tax=Pectinophora gossypiella TaxID=13191 RepID=UPI00214E80D5|nr:uncharacterized protein LOC126374491 [Pectinophora gossypiella]
MSTVSDKMYTTGIVVLALCVVASLQVPSERVLRDDEAEVNATDSTGGSVEASASTNAPGTGGGGSGQDVISGIFQSLAANNSSGSSFWQSAAPFFNLFSKLPVGGQDGGPDSNSFTRRKFPWQS